MIGWRCRRADDACADRRAARLGRAAYDRLAGGVRRYDDGDIRRLRFIRTAQTAGFTLEEIGELLALDATDDRPRAHAIARERIAALDARIAELQAAREALVRLADRCASSGSGPCPILTAFEP